MAGSSTPSVAARFCRGGSPASAQRFISGPTGISSASPRTATYILFSSTWLWCIPRLPMHRRRRLMRPVIRLSSRLRPVNSAMPDGRTRASSLRMCCLLLCLLLTTSAVGTLAQTGAAITGRTEDATGSAVAGVTVTVKSLETGATRVVTTDETGRFWFLALPLGQQEVKAEKREFKTVVRTGINLEVGQEAVVNLRLEIGEFIQQVLVSNDTAIVNTTTSEISGIVGEREVKELPLNGRSFDNLITLNPGAINYNLKSPQTSTTNGNTL